MKKLCSTMNRIARLSLSLILCLSTLLGNVPAAIFEQTALVEQAAVAEGPSETYFSDEVNSNDIITPIGIQSTGAPVSAALSTVANLTMELYYKDELGVEKPLTTGTTLPSRSTGLRLVLRFALTNAIWDCNGDYTFYYDTPTGLTFAAVAKKEFYDTTGAHLMDWSSTSSRISVQFTEDFYKEVRNDVSGFVELTATLKPTVITDGKQTFDFPGMGSITLNFPPEAPYIYKYIYKYTLVGDNLVISYAAYVYAYDNYKKLVLSDVPGTNVDYPRKNVEVHDGGTSGTYPTTQDTRILHTVDSSGNYVIEDAAGATICQKGRYYYIIYDVEIPLAKVLDGTLSDTTATTRRNTMTAMITDNNGESKSSSSNTTASYSMSNVVSVSKSGTTAIDTNGRMIFTITLTVKSPMKKVILKELPYQYLRNGIFTDVSDSANPVVLTLTDNTYTINNPVVDKIYKFTYAVDFPFAEYAAGLINYLTSANRVDVTWETEGGATGTVYSSTYMFYSSGKFQPPSKVPSSTTSPIRINDDGDYVVDFTVTVPASSTSNYFNEVYLTDTLGDYMTLIPASVEVRRSTITVPHTLEQSGDGKSFTLRLGNDTTKYDGSYTYYAYYTVKLDSNAVEGGLLSSDITEADTKASRTNTVRLDWKAYVKNPTTGEIERTFTGNTAESKYEITYDTPVKPIDISKANAGIKYLADGTPYVDYTITFGTTRPVSEVVIEDLKGAMFEQTARDGWAATVKRGGAAYQGPDDEYTYNRFVFKNLLAGTYTIDYRVYLAKGFNGLTYTQVLADESARTNTAKMTYPGTNGPETVTAYSTVTAYEVDIEKTGGFRWDEDHKEIEMITIGGIQYGILDWTVTITTNSTNMNLNGGYLIESLMGRQFYAENDVAKINSFLTVNNLSGFATIASHDFNTVGNRQYLQEFTYKIGSKGESVTAVTNTYKFVSYAQIPDANTLLVATNQAVFEHPYWGRYVATAEDEYVWAHGTVPPVVINKELVKLDATTNKPAVTATWKITIPVVTGQIITSALLTDYMNFPEPYSAFQTDDFPLNLTVAYEDGSGSPSYDGPTFGMRDGVPCLYIDFTEDLHKNVIVTLNTYHSDIDSVEKSREYINFADLEYTTNHLGGERYTVSQDYWSVNATVIEKTGSEPRFDATANKYVIDWNLTLKDAFRVGLNTRLQDILPEGLTLLPGTVSSDPGTFVSLDEGTGDDAGTFIIVVKPVAEETHVAFSTSIDDEYLNSYQRFVNRVNVLVREPSSSEVAATDTATVETESVRSLTKAGKVVYNEDKDRYEIVWTIKLSDETRRNQTIYLNDTLPDGVTYVEGSAVSTPTGRIQSATLAGDGKSVMFVLSPAASGVAEIQFATEVDDAKLTQANEMYAFVNHVDLLKSSDPEDILLSTDAICNLSGGVREFTKTGDAHYDAAKDEFAIDWTIVLDEQARVNRQVILHETLPEGLTLGNITVTAGEGGVPVAFEIINETPDGREFDIVFTPPISRTVITIRTYDERLDDTEASFTAVYTNQVDLVTRDGDTYKVIDTATATVDFDTNKTFIKNPANEPIAYNEELGKYVINWTLNLQAPLAVGRAIVIEDTIPEGLSPFDVSAVTCSDTEQPDKLSYTYNATSRKLTINVTPSSANMTLVVHTTINSENLFYDGTDVPKYVNVAKVVTYNLTDDAEATFGLKPSEVLYKSGVQTAGTNMVVYTIKVNEKGIDLSNGESEITLEDVLDEHYTMLLDTVTVKNGTTGAVIPPQDYQVQYNAATRLLSFRLPNRTYLIFTFSVLINGTPGETITVDNTIKLKGTGLSASTGDQIVTVQKVSEGMDFDTNYVKIIKYDSSDASKMIEGAKFKLVKVDHITGTETEIAPDITDLTNASGVLYLPNPTNGLVINTLYYIQEVAPPEGYLLDSTKHYFVVPGRDEGVANTAVAAIKAKYPLLTILVSRSPQFTLNNWIDLKSRIIVKKVATGTELPLLSGAALEIRDAETGGNLIHSFPSGSVQTVLENLKLSGAHLQAGKTYWLVETTPPAGYLLANAKPFTLTSTTIVYNGINTTILSAEVKLEDSPIEIPVYKQDEHGRAVAGAKLEIIDTAGNVKASWTSKKEAYSAKALVYGTMYGLRETAAAPGYFKTDDVIWFMREDSDTLLTYKGTNTPPDEGLLTKSTTGVQLTLKNKAKVEIYKVDDEMPTPQPVIGAVLELYVGDRAVGTPILTWTTDGKPYVVERELFAGPYTVHERSDGIPNGYEAALDGHFTIPGEDNETIIVSLTDKKIRNMEISVKKTWADNNNQDGYQTLSIKAILTGKVGTTTVVTKEAILNSANGWTNAADKWVVPIKDDVTKQTIVYTVDEETTPMHYTKSITGDAQNGFVITNTHVPEKVAVTVEKKWMDNNNEKGARPVNLEVVLLAGATEAGRTTLSGTGDTWSYTWNDLPRKAGGVDIAYTVQEVNVPTGYVPSIKLEPGNATVPGDTTYKITVTNTLANTIINKFGSVNLGNEVKGTQGLAGAEFQVWNKEKTERLLTDMTLVSDADGVVNIGNKLNPGEYWLVETKAPTGYYKADDVEFTVTGNDQPIAVYDPATVVVLRKVDKTDPNKRLPGAYLAIYATEAEAQAATKASKGTPVAEFTTTDGTLVVTAAGKTQIGTYNYGAGAVVLEGVLEAGKTYFVKELEAPEGYLNGSWSFVVTNTVGLTEKTLDDTLISLTDVWVQKEWDDLGITGITHPDITFDLYRSDDNQTPFASQTLSHGEDMYAFRNLYRTDPDGAPYTYTVKERPVTGYHSEESLGMNNVIVFTNTRTTATVSKVTKDVSGVSHLVEGAKLEIWTTGSPAVKVVDEFTSSGTAATDLVGVLTPGVEYELREVGLPAGFVQTPAVKFTFTGKTVAGELVNEPTVVIIQKVNRYGEFVANASLEIRDSAGTKVWGGTSSNETQVFTWNNLPLIDATTLGVEDGTIVLVGILESGKTYSLVETKPPSGYLKADPITITPDASGAITPIEMIDEPDPTEYEVKIYKNDQYGDPVVGAKLRLTKTLSGEFVEWVTTDKPYVISLRASTSAVYKLEEIVTPEGYQKAVDITFAVSDQEDSVNVGIYMIDELIDRNVHGKKTWNLRGLSAKPVTIQLYQDGVPYKDAAGNEVFTTIPVGTTTYEFLHLPAVDGNDHKYVYTVVELPVPGFGTVQDGTNFTNTATRLEIKKVDESGELLDGAVFGLYDSSNNLVGTTWNTTDENPKEFVGVLNAGAVYTLKEIEAPLGYKPIADRTITISTDGSEQVEVVPNTKKDWEVSVRKVAMTGSTEVMLPGAIMGLYADGDNWQQSTPLASWNTTTANPKTFTDLDPTIVYHVAEITPPTGYLNPADIGEPVITFTVDDVDANGELVITMKNYQTKLFIDKLVGSVHLADAVLEIRDASGTPVRRWTSDGSSHMVLGLTPGMTYTLHEVKPPDGYATNPKAIQFRVNMDGTMSVLGEVDNDILNLDKKDLVTGDIANPSLYEGYQAQLQGTQLSVQMQNDPLDVSISKLSALTGHGLEGATLALFKGSVAEVNLVERWVSETGAHKITEPLEAGATYILVEELSPEGYHCASQVSIVIQDTQEPQVFDMTDYPTRVVIEKRVEPNGAFVPNATLTLLDNVTMQAVRTWTTGGAGEVFEAELIAGRSYTLTELQTPAGYVTADPITFTVSMIADEETIITYEMIDRKIAVEVTKRDEGGALLGGASFALYLGDTADGTALETWNTTDSNPHTIAYPLVEGRKYTIRETASPAGYYRAVDQTFAVEKGKENYNFSFVNNETRVSISKYDQQTNKMLAGASLTLMDSAGGVVESWPSTESAHLLQKTLIAGERYTLIETAAPAGFGIADPVTFTVPAVYPDQVADGTYVIDVKMYDPHLYYFSKVDDETGEALSGARLYIRDKNNLVVVPQWTSSATEPYEVRGILKPDTEYYLVEHQAPEGYTKTTEVPFTVGADGMLATVVMRDKKTEVSIEKRDALAGNMVAGARLRLWDTVLEQTVEEWTTATVAKVFKGLIVGRDYVLTEISTPAGYYTAAPITFTVSETGVTPKIVMIDDPVVVEISKVDEDGRLLGGADLSLYQGTNANNGVALENWNTTSSNPHRIRYSLVEGETYTIREVAAPNGYFCAPDITFTVTAQRNESGRANNIQLVMRDYETRVAIEKYDEQLNAPMSGASLSLLDTTGAVLDTWVSNGTPHVFKGELLAGGVYTLRENSAPAGFAVADPITFTVPTRPTGSTANVTMNGEIPTYTRRMYNQHIYKFSKTDFDTGLPLAGATLYIRDESGKVIVPEWVSTTSPYEVRGTLKVGEYYYLVEKAAPSGYSLNGDLPFYLAADATLNTVVMRNRRTVVPTPPPGGGGGGGGDDTTVDIAVTKIWQDNNNASGQRPSSITLNLYRKATTDAGYPSTPYGTATVNGTGNTWSYTFADLPQTESGVRYDYLVQEASVSGYTASYANNGRTITNQLTSLTTTPFATPTTAVGGRTALAARQPVGVRFVDGEWVYLDEYDTPLGVVPLTGDDSNWLLWIAAAMIPVLGIGVAGVEIHRRAKKKKPTKASSSNKA